MNTDIRAFFLTILCFIGCSQSLQARENDGNRLATQIAPWLEMVTGHQQPFTLIGSGSPVISGKPQDIEVRLVRFDAESFDLSMVHSEYAVSIRRRVNGIAFCLPKHNVVFLGEGTLDQVDHLSPTGIVDRLVGSGTSAQMVTQLMANAKANDVASALVLLGKAAFSEEKQAWVANDICVKFSSDGKQAECDIDGTKIDLRFEPSANSPLPFDTWTDMQIRPVDRAELEKQLARGARRALEILAPSKLLTSPRQSGKVVENGELRWIEGQRVALLHGSPEEIGEAHGRLLKQEAVRCIDSVLYTFGTVQTVATGRWFREDLEQAYARLSPHIPERHKIETRALASSLVMDPDLIEALNVFPELFHCSGFALSGKATVDGKLYHGRVLDYMTAIGLQDAATTFIVAPEGKIPFANVGYAGFIGSVSGMNAEQISLGEMGGHGEGMWDGVPMATLMRRALEECSSLEQVKELWQNNPRTCEYYYVFADGKDRSSVGVAATPEELQFVAPGEFHPLLGDGIEDAVVLSSGSRLEELRKRVKAEYGTIDTEKAQRLMSRPVAMSSNLHNVLFVPEDGVLYVANADHKHPAAERPYVKLNLKELLAQMPGQPSNQDALSISLDSKFDAVDSLNIGHESIADARACLDGLRWEPSAFKVSIEPATQEGCDWLVRFPSAKPCGNARNDSVAMEWYQAKDKLDGSGRPIHAPAAVVVHESGSNMNFGRIIAKSLRLQGIHAFMIQLPYYGVRRGPEGRPTGINMLVAMQQAISDARRAKDAVASIPLVDNQRISLQGTSLGGFVTATTAGLDRSYHRVFVLLAGGDLYGVLMDGKKEAAKVKNLLVSGGMNDADIRSLFSSIEPLRLAHRVDPERTWLFSGRYDDIVPPRNSKLFAEAAHLPPAHHVEMYANHYSGILFLPLVTGQMSRIMHEPAD